MFNASAGGTPPMYAAKYAAPVAQEPAMFRSIEMTHSPAQGVTAALRPRPRVTRLAAQLTCLVALSALSTGCSLLPFGKGRSAKMARAMRPEVHEVTPNAQSECLAEDAKPTAPAAAAADVTTACATCACGATASAKTGGAAKRAVTASAPVPAALAVATAGRPERQLQRLMDGNKRFVEGEADHDLWARALTRGELTAVTGRAAPAAVVIAPGGADGDMVSDAVFDARPGELLVIPSPADITDEAVVATVRDAVQHYEIPLIVVLGRRQQQQQQPVSDDSIARQASLKLGGGFAEYATGQAGGALSSVDRLISSDASLVARVAVGRLKVVAVSCDEVSGQVSLDLGVDGDAVETTKPAELVGLPQD
jgi:hypothetical protein